MCVCCEFEIFKSHKSARTTWSFLSRMWWTQISEEKSPAFIQSTTTKQFLRIIQVISDTFSIHIGKWDPFRSVCFATVPFFPYTDSYHPHQCLKIVFFKPAHIQFHQAVQPSDKLYPSCIPYLLKEVGNIYIFMGKKSFLFPTLHHKASSMDLFCWSQLQYWWVFHPVSKGSRTSSLDLLCLGRWWVARQTTYLHTGCLSSQPQTAVHEAVFSRGFGCWISFGFLCSWPSSTSCLQPQALPEPLPAQSVASGMGVVGAESFPQLLPGFSFTHWAALGEHPSLSNVIVS